MRGCRAGAVSNDKFGWEQQVPAAARWSAPMGDCAGERGGGSPAFALSVLTHGGERGLHASGDGVVVESDDRHIFWHAQVRLMKSADHSAGDRVGEAENPRGPSGVFEDRLHRVV